MRRVPGRHGPGWPESHRQGLRRSKSRVGGRRERNRSLSSGQIMAEKLGRGCVVIRAAAVWKEMTKRLGNHVQTFRIAGSE